MSVNNVSGSSNVWSSVLEKMSSEKAEEKSVQEQIPTISTDSKDEEVSLNLETEEIKSENTKEVESKNTEEIKGSFEYISNLLKLEDKTADDFRIIKDDQDRITYMDNQIKNDEDVENNIITGYKILYGENGDVMITPFSVQSLIPSETTTYKEDGSKSVVKKDINGKIISELNYDKDGKEIKAEEVSENAETSDTSETPSAVKYASTAESSDTSETSSAVKSASTAESSDTSETSSAAKSASTAESSDTSETSSAVKSASTAESSDTSETSSAVKSASTTESSNTSQTSSAVKSASTTETSDTSETSSAVKSASTTESSDTSEISNTSETSDVSETSNISDTSETQDVSEKTSENETETNNTTNFVYKLLSSIIQMILSGLNEFFNFFRTFRNRN